MAGDFAVFLGASQVLRGSGDPYDRAQLYSAERRLLVSQGVEPPRPAAFIRVGNPPVMFWLLQPLLRVSFRSAAWTWMALMYVLSLAAFLLFVNYLGWRRRAIAAFAFLVLPQTVYAAYYGNVDALVLAALAGGIYLIRRQPLPAGVALAAVWLKPQVGLPLALLSILFLACDRRRAAMGFATGTATIVAASGILTGPGTLLSWAQSLVGYSRQLSVQPDIASLSGLYVYHLSGAVALALQLLLPILAAIVTAWWWTQLRRRRRMDRAESPINLAEIAWLWPLWFLATPFAHFHDEVVLVLPLIACLGLHASRVLDSSRIAALYCFLFALLLFPVSVGDTDFQSLALVPLTFALFRISRAELAASPSQRSKPRNAGTPLLEAAG